jgi:parallel beta-helix repeat protein
MNKIITTTVLMLILSGMIISTIKILPVRSQGISDWQIENGGGNYSEANGTITLWSETGGWLNLYQQFTPTSDFNVSLEVQAVALGGFALMLRNSLPFFGSVDGVNFEFGARDNGTFLLARYASGWTWNEFANATENVWYTLELSVFGTPFHIVGQVLDNGTLLGTLSINDMTNTNLETITYIGFGIWTPGEYLVRNISMPTVSSTHRTWTVDKNGSADFTTIQDAVGNASDGDTISVKAGTYSGPIQINKALTLVGENENTTIIDGGSNEPSGSVVDVTSDNVNISNFTIEHCRAGGNAIWLDGYVNMTFSYNIITDCNEGVRILYSSGDIVSCNNIQGCYYNTGLGFNWAYNNTVYGNILANNNIGIGGNFWNITFFNNTIRDNVGGWAGWGISDNFYDCVFYHNNIINNGQQVYNTNTNSNIWDNGHPSGGNYWSDYSTRYPNAAEIDNSGLWNTPYVIDANNTDNYPLMNEFPPSSGSVAPVADFTYSPLTPIANETVTFDASISKNGWNGTQSIAISTYAWDFGDNNSASGQAVTHVYQTSGNFTVTLNVTDAQGLWNITEKQVQVGQPQSPIAAFIINPEFTYVGQDIQLNASASLPGWNGSQEDPITSYVWDFGDGNVTSGDNSTSVHSYVYAGDFNVTLTVSDSENMNSSCSQTILVIMPTSVSVSTSATSSLIGYVVSINGTLSDVYGNPIENEPVVLYYTFPGITSLFPMTSSTTDNNGQYNAQWIPTATGTFCIIAEWTGNMTYSEASSNVTLNCISAMNQYVFSVESNSTISALAFNTTSQELSFTASGPSGTTGYARITIAKSLVTDITNIRVYLDNNQTEYSIVSLDDSWLLMFNYTHSTHRVAVDLNVTTVPEFPSTIFLALLLIFFSACVVLIKKKRIRIVSHPPLNSMPRIQSEHPRSWWKSLLSPQ